MCLTGAQFLVSDSPLSISMQPWRPLALLGVLVSLAPER